MRKALPLGAKIEAIKKAIKSGQKFYLHTYIGKGEVTGIANDGHFAQAKGRSWAICSTHIDTWYAQLGEIEPEAEADINEMPGVNIVLMSIEKLTEDEKHNWGDLTLNEQRQVLDDMVPFNTKANILTCDGDEYACYLCKNAFSSEAHLRQHIKAHLRKMGATGDAYNVKQQPKAKSVSARSFFRGVPGRGVDY